jgi:hypothetical protein
MIGGAEDLAIESSENEGVQSLNDSIAKSPDEKCNLSPFFDLR